MPNKQRTGNTDNTYDPANLSLFAELHSKGKTDNRLVVKLTTIYELIAHPYGRPL